MNIETMISISLIFLAVITVLAIILLKKLGSISQEQLSGKLEVFEKNLERLEKAVNDQISRNREETAASSRQAREEINKTLLSINDQLVKSFGEFSNMQKNQLDTFSQNLINTGNSIEQRSNQTQQMVESKITALQAQTGEELNKIRVELDSGYKNLKNEVSQSLARTNDSMLSAIKGMNDSNNTFLETIRSQMQRLTDSNRENFETTRAAIETKLAGIQQDNTAKLLEIRQEVITESRQMREDTSKSLLGFNDSITSTMKNINEAQNNHLKEFSEKIAELTRKNEEKLESLRTAIETKLAQIQTENTGKMAEIRKESGENAKLMREDQALSMKNFGDTVSKTLSEMTTGQKQNFDSIFKHIGNMIEANGKKAEELRNTIETRLMQIQDDNTKKLEEMRKTVDEKLHSTLEKRLGESFNIVSERLELVHKGLGEMQVLASGVGDLKRVLTNVKARGTWGEIQLGNLLEQILTPGQYEKNVKPKAGSSEIVEFAIKLPGKSLKDNDVVWLPIDAKFPQEQYLLILEASEKGDAAAVEQAVKLLEVSIRKCAKDICDKYLNPPHTTDFAIMFLPVEGLYAEVLRRSGLAEQIQRDFRVVISGPSTFAAILNSLQMGFRTLAIEKRSSEVWNVLAAVKTEFNKFGEVIEKVKNKIEAAGKEISNVSTRTRAIDKKLTGIQSLPSEESINLPVLPAQSMFLDKTDEEEPEIINYKARL
jgi:DNA recombination protein RmuC